MRRMWNRPYVPRLRSGELPWMPAEASLTGLAPGTQLRVLSRDPADGAMSCLWRIPPGWSQALPFALAADAELFVLEGSLLENGQSLHGGAYLHRPAGMAYPWLASRDGATLYAMWSATPALREVTAEGQRAAEAAHVVPADGGIALTDATPPGTWIDTGGMAEHPTPVHGPPAGISVRILRRDATTGGMTLIVSIEGSWEETRSEHHDCVEESFKLSGDIWLRENQRPHVLEAGDYFFRPPRIKHGPMRTQKGTTSLIRFSGTVVNHYGPIVD